MTKQTNNELKRIFKHFIDRTLKLAFCISDDKGKVTIEGTVDATGEINKVSKIISQAEAKAVHGFVESMKGELYEGIAFNVEDLKLLHEEHLRRADIYLENMKQ